MRKRQIILVTLLSSGLTLLLLAGALLIFSQAAAAPARQATAEPAYISLSALAFGPLTSTQPYRKNVARQMLTLSGQPPNFSSERNLFVAPLTLPDRKLLTEMAIFGEDFDSQGLVLVRLRRCDHSLGRCLTLTEASSTAIFSLGRFGPVGQVPQLNEVIDNALYSYLLELELTAQGDSGLRSVRLALLDGPPAGSPPPPANVGERWQLAGNSTSFFIPNTESRPIRVCTDDLSSLPNATHYPVLISDGQTTPLASNSCVTVSGRTIEIRRPISAGSSAGTYQILP